METPKYDSYVCTAKILNDVQGTTITKILATFTYYDGTTSNDPPSGSPEDVNIGFQEAGYLMSQNNCVTSCYVFVLTDNAGSFDSTQNAPTNYCLISPLFELTPRTAVLHNEENAKPSKPHIVLNNGHGII